MAKVILFVPEQEFVIDDDADFDELVEVAEADELDLRYDIEVSNLDIQTEFVIEETD